MKRKWMALAGAGLITAGMVAGIGFWAGRRSAARTPALETQKEKLSYAMGLGLAKRMKRQAVDIDIEVVSKGLRDEFSGKDVLMSEAEMQEAITAFQEELKQKQAATSAQLEERRKRNEAFLAENAKREGVVTLPSGLQYEILAKGNGKTPVDGDIVQIHYRGTRLDGTEFENTYAAGRTASYLLSRTLPGWKEALKLMPVGSKWKLFLPARLAYGQKGLRTKRPGVFRVEPNAPVIFELELVAIGPPASPNPQTAVGTAAPAATREN
jgi:FKBP-type peptidyl-prolyl cis-trans isomerase